MTVKKDEAVSKKWVKEYHGFESIIDIVEDIDYCDVIPNGEWEGTVVVTIEYKEDKP